MVEEQTLRMQINVRYKFDRSPNYTDISRPRPIGLYSLNQKREYMNSPENLSYFVIPKKYPLNLNHGYEFAIKKDPTQKHYLYSMLHFICHNKQKLLQKEELSHKPRLRHADIVCFRGLLRLIMDTPYQFGSDWRLLVSKLNGTIYMCQDDTPQDVINRENQTEMLKRLSSWGFKFEQFCLATDPKVPPDTSQPVDECSELDCVFTSNLCDIKLMFGAEMDGIISQEAIDITKPIDLHSLRFVELKTRLLHMKANQMRNFTRHTSRKWWCQSYLSGIDDIYVGLRNENGFVHSIDKISVQSLRSSARGWSAAICLDFLKRFLHTVLEIMFDIEDPKIVMQFDFDAQRHQIYYKKIEQKIAPDLLPMWYINEFGNA